MLKIITDTASDITREQAGEMNIHIVPLSIQFSDGLCPQTSDVDFPRFYARLAAAEEFPVTSCPSPEDYLRYFEKARDAGDEVLVLTLSSGLSGTINSARLAKELCSYAPIYIVDSRQAILAQRILVEHAVKLRDQNVPTEELIRQLEELRDRITVSGVLDTLTYLRKGGRIPASLAVMGNTLQIKPVIALQDKVLKMVGKAFGREAGWRHLHKRFEQYPPDPDFPIYFGYTSDRDLGEQFMKRTVEKYSLQSFCIRLYPVGGVIGAHVGNGCVAICYVAKDKII